MSETTRNFPKEIKDLKATLRHGRGRLGREWLEILHGELRIVRKQYRKHRDYVWKNE